MDSVRLLQKTAEMGSTKKRASLVQKKWDWVGGGLMFHVEHDTSDLLELFTYFWKVSPPLTDPMYYSPVGGLSFMLEPTPLSC